MPPKSPPRVAIVGLGTIGRIHAERILRLDAALAAGADVRADARELFAGEYDVPTYADHETMLADADIDAVFVCVPNRVHEQVAIDALEHECAVLLEKPLAHSVESAERIAAAAADAEASCVVGFTMRFSNATRRVAALRDEGRLGSVSHVDATYLRRNALPGEGRGWFTDPDLAGGGVAMDLGVHALDLALYLLEYPTVREVTGVTRSEFGDYDVEDSAHALVRCGDDRTISIRVSWRATRSSSKRCIVRGSDAGVEFNVTEPTLDVFDTRPVGTDESDGRPTGPDEMLSVDGGDMHLAEDRAFLATLAGERTALAGTVEDALTVQRVLRAIYDSSDRGEAVRPSEYQ
ncbi:Gfo/Idh/MocA family protein [Natrialba aegyptia]|uniref:Oxidoreductase domain-containing protein n=1 Tax=Natrialba aegyptia DSM 13077 TaxID=1227491 RepID=M0ALS9_9EURY|nr:Gfo/Idh/MocA family oxidoreductase [Natrialba aegyptia]ELY98338.1 oxidoreductase domain-containing protein [Natrialba aegyptia DSM 13077]